MGRQKGAAERSKHKSASSSTFGLQSQGTQIFTGFGQEAIDPNVDPRLKVSLRKISKKDAITKTKACNELLELISEENKERNELIHPLLVTWPRYYQKLVMESDPRVRSQSHQVTVNLLLLAQKQSAPHLKAIMEGFESYNQPALLFGTCDEYSISSSIASAGVLKVFLNDEKIKNLVIHVRSDLAPFLIDQVLRKPEKNDADSELEVIRTSSQALRTLSKFYQKTADKDEQENQPKIMNMDAMMDSKIFWKLGRSKEAQVRAGFFEFGLAYLRNTNVIPDKNLENWTKSILSSLGEEDPLCLKPLWAAVLLILKKSQTDSKIFEHVNFLKAFVPGLWSVLRGGAFGCGSIIYPHTLPLLANVPKELAVDPFYPNFFNNFADGIRDIESKTEVKHGLLGLFECYQYAAKNEMIPDVCERVSSIISNSIRNESTIKIPDLAQPLYKLLSTFKKNQEHKYDEILTSLHNVINDITTEMQNPTRESFQLLENCCKLVEILYRTETMAQRKAGVHFTTEGAKETEVSAETLLTDDLLDLVILLVAPFDQSDPLISAVQLMVISFLTKSKNSKWMTKVFSKIHQKLYSGSLDENESDRNALLMEKFIIPKLENAFQADLDSSIAALTSKTRNVMISLKYDSDDEDHVSPSKREESMKKSDGSKEILSSVTDMIFYLASGNASSCTKLLKISTDPEKIVPLLPFICRKIKENDDDEANKTLQDYYSQCSLLNHSHIVAILLQNGPRSLVEDICGDISVQFEEAQDLTTLIKLVKLRFSMARDVAEHIPVGLNKLGASWARLVFNDGHPNDSGTDATQNIIDIVSSFFPIAIFANFIQSILDLFTKHDFSTVTFAKIIEYLTMIKQTCQENDEDSENNQFIPMIHNLFEHKLNSFGENCEKSRIDFLRQLIGVDAADQSSLGSSANNNFFNQYLLKLIVFNLLTIDEISPNMIESISKSKSQLLPFSGYVVSEKRGWQSVELGPNRLSETFGFLVFEFSKIEIECSRTDGDDFHILISEILTETEIPIHSKYFKITESDDESLLIGALEQLRIIGVGDFMPDSSRDYLAARANFCKLFQSCIVHASGELNSDQWDFILCNTVEWLNDIAEAIDEKITADQLVLMNATLRLLKSVGQFLNSPSARTDPSLPTDLLTTWTEFFMPEIAKNVFTLIIKFKEEDELLENLTWMNIYDVTAFIGLDSLLKMEVPLSLSLDLKCPDNVNSLFNHFYKNLKSSSQINATISASFIKMLLSQIIEKDGKEPPVYILNQTEKLLSNENQIHSAVLAGTVYHSDPQGQILTWNGF